MCSQPETGIVFDGHLLFTPFSHALAVSLLLNACAHGYTTHFFSKFDFIKYLEFIEANRVSRNVLVKVFFLLKVNHGRQYTKKKHYHHCLCSPDLIQTMCCESIFPRLFVKNIIYALERMSSNNDRTMFRAYTCRPYILSKDMYWF